MLETVIEGFTDARMWCIRLILTCALGSGLLEYIEPYSLCDDNSWKCVIDAWSSSWYPSNSHCNEYPQKKSKTNEALIQNSLIFIEYMKMNYNYISYPLYSTLPSKKIRQLLYILFHKVPGGKLSLYNYCKFLHEFIFKKCVNFATIVILEN